MTTLTSPTTPDRLLAAEPGPRSASAGVPFHRLALVEARKLVDTRAGRGILLAIGLVTLAAVALVLLTGDPAELTWSSLSLTSALPQAVLLPVLGILTATGEWSQRTGLVTFTLEPRRVRVGAAKLVAVVAVAVLAVAAALAFGALANVVGMLWRDGDGSWALDGSVLAGSVLVQVLGVVQGLAFGAAIGNSAAAILGVLVLPTLWTILSAMVSALAAAAPWLNLQLTSLPLLAGSLTGEDWARLGTSVGLWVLLPLALGTYRLVHREIS